MNRNTTGQSLTPYSFEGRDIRLVQREGEPWFVAGDAAAMLGYDHTPHLSRLLEDDEKGVHKVDTLGGSQDVAVISEAGLYRAIVQRRASTKIAAETRDGIARFQRWVFHDVLPSIRKDGIYVTPRAAKPTNPDAARISLAREARLTFNDHLKLCKMSGVTGSDAMIAANQATIAVLGVDRLAVLNMKRLPNDADSAQINTTTLGQQLGLSAQETNKNLVSYGYATVYRDAKDRLVYEPTEKGRATGGRVVSTGKKHADGTPVTQLLWSVITVEALRKDMHGGAQ